MIRIVRLLRVAAQAEGLRWRRTGRNYAIKAGLAAGAAVFGLLLLMMLHMAAFAWIARGQGPVAAALIIAAADLVIAGLLGWLAGRRDVDPVAAEAEHVRDDALRQVGDQAARAAVILPVLRSGSMKKGLVGAALTAAVVGLIARR
jgi:hypothetical protein